MMMMITGIRLKEKSKKFAKLVTGISHKHRLGILYLLSHKPMEAHDIAETIDLPDPLVSHHLKNMFVVGWVRKIKIGRSVTYEIDEKIFKHLEKFFEDTPLDRNVLLRYSK